MGVGVALVYMVTGQKETVDIEENDRTMRPSLDKKKVKGRTRFKIDATWLDAPDMTPDMAPDMAPDMPNDRGEVIAFVPPGSRKPLAARAVAVPGDRISVRDGKLHVNDRPAGAGERVMPVKHVPEFVCPRDSFYVLFDRAKGRGDDSAGHGPVPAWRVLGRLEL